MDKSLLGSVKDSIVQGFQWGTREGPLCDERKYPLMWLNRNERLTNALASDALYRYRNAVLRNCTALFDFKMTLFYVFDDAVFA